MPVTVGHTTSTSPASAPIADLTAAIAELRADFQTFHHSQAPTADDRFDQLSRQFSSLRREVSEIRHPQHHVCAASDYTSYVDQRNPSGNVNHRRYTSDRWASPPTSPRHHSHHEDDAPPRHRSPGRWQTSSVPRQPPCYDDAYTHRSHSSPNHQRKLVGAAMADLRAAPLKPTVHNDTDKLRTSPYHAQCDWAVERYNRTLKEELSKYILEERVITHSFPGRARRLPSHLQDFVLS
ncbi:unnamed protein product [Merluccius merluccius]